MYKRLKSFLEKHDILYKYQYGFRTNHSTTHELADVLKYIYSVLDGGNYVIKVYVDFKKVFDSVSHDILLPKTTTLWHERLSIKLVFMSLHDRKQYASVNGTNSDLQKNMSIWSS